MNEIDLKTDFGSFVAKIRKEKQLSQEALADKCDLDRTYISMMERGKKQPTLTTLMKLSNAFEMKLSELFINYENESKK